MKAVVVTAGEADARDADQLAGADLLIAVDGGARWLDRLGAVPHLLLGDLDSVDDALVERLGAAGVEVRRHRIGKDESDAELALGHAVEAGAGQIVMIGALGGDRLDHELANLLLLADPRWHSAGCDVRIVRGGTQVRALHGGSRLVLDAAPGDLVTLLAVGDAADGVRTDGLRYPLAGDTLLLGWSRGLSNQVERAPASVSLESGTLLVIETRAGGTDELHGTWAD
jgi:thiamine pyrophosphokinase